MASFSTKTSGAEPQGSATTRDAARAITAMPFEVSKRIGLASFKVNTIADLDQSARTPESYLGVMGECEKLRVAIRQEVGKVQKDDPVIPPLKELDRLAFRIWESCAQLADFEQRTAVPANSEPTSSEVTSAHFLARAIPYERQKLKEALEQLAELIPPTAPQSSPLLKRVSVAVATLGLFFGAEHSLNLAGAIDAASPIRTSKNTTTDANEADTMDLTLKHQEPIDVNIVDTGPVTYDSKRSVRFLTDSIRADNLWMGDVYVRSQSGLFVRAQQSKSPNELSLVAQVRDSRDEIQPGASIELVAPLGFSPRDIEVTDHEGTAVPFTVTRSGYVVVSSEHDGQESNRPSNRPLTITYGITESTTEFQLPPAVSTDIVRPIQHHDIIMALRSDPTTVEEAMDSIFREYLYVVSDELNAIIATFRPLNNEEIYGNIGIADCDGVSVVAAGLLNEAGIRAGVVTGYVESEGRLSDVGHAKLLYRDSSDQLRSYECTRSMSDAFRGVTFSEPDKRLLHELGEMIRQAPNPVERGDAYAAFRQALRDIFQKPEYAQFRIQPEPSQAGSGGGGMGAGGEVFAGSRSRYQLEGSGSRFYPPGRDPLGGTTMSPSSPRKPTPVQPKEEPAAKKEAKQEHRSTGTKERTVDLPPLPPSQERTDFKEIVLLVSQVIGLAVGPLITALGIAQIYKRGLTRITTGYLTRIRSGIQNPLHNEPTERTAPSAVSLKEFEKRLDDSIEYGLQSLEKRFPGITAEFSGFERLPLRQRQTISDYVDILTVCGEDESLPNLLYLRRLSVRLEKEGAELHTPSAVLELMTSLPQNEESEERKATVMNKVAECMREAHDRISKESSPKGVSARLRRDSRKHSPFTTSDPSGEFDSLREIRPGETAGRINYKASARLGKLVGNLYRPVVPEPRPDQSNIHLILDLTTCGDNDIVRLATFLMRSDADTRLSSVSICSHGEMHKVYEQPALRKMLADGKGKTERIKSVVQYCVERYIDHVSEYTIDKEIRERMREGAIKRFPIGLLSRKGKVIVLGNYLLRDYAQQENAPGPRRRMSRG